MLKDEVETEDEEDASCCKGGPAAGAARCVLPSLAGTLALPLTGACLGVECATGGAAELLPTAPPLAPRCLVALTLPSSTDAAPPARGGAPLVRATEEAVGDASLEEGVWLPEVEAAPPRWPDRGKGELGCST